MTLKRPLSILLALTLLLSLSLPFASAEEEGRTIKMLLNTKSFDMNTDYVATTLEEITGYHVQYDYYSDDNQLAMEVASGTDYDLIYTTPTMYQTLLSQGALKDLSPILEQYPDVKEAISDLGWTYVTHEDGIYGIPNVDDAVYVGGIAYRTDIFEEYGYTEPATIDEFYDLLVSIKEDTGLIPLTGRSAVEARHRVRVWPVLRFRRGRGNGQHRLLAAPGWHEGVPCVDEQGVHRGPDRHRLAGEHR